MAFHRSIKTTRLELAPGFRFFGATTKLAITVRVDLGDTGEVVHEPTRTRLANGGAIPLQPSTTTDVPAVDQQGWVDGQGAPASGWSYVVTVTATGQGSSRIVWTGATSPTIADGVVVLDPSEGGTIVGGAAASSGGVVVNPVTGGVPSAVPNFAEKAFRGVPLITYGHSFLAEQGVPDATKYYARRLASHYGMVYPTLNATNDLKRAIGGSRAEDAANRMVGTAAPLGVNEKGVVLIQPLLNSARKHGVTTPALNGARNAVRAMCATASAGQRIENTDPMFTYSGFWTPTEPASGFSGSSQTSTATAGAAITFTVPAYGCHAVISGRKEGLSAAVTEVRNMTAGGSLIATVNNVDQAPADISGSYVPIAIPLNVPAGTQVQLLNPSTRLTFDVLLVPAENPRPVVLMKDPYLADYSLSTSYPNGSDAVLDAFNALIDEVGAEFVNTIVADPNEAGYWDESTGLQADGVHPNEVGNKALFEAARDALNLGALQMAVRSAVGLA